MIAEIPFKASNFNDCVGEFFYKWHNKKLKVFVFRAIDSIAEVREFYESNFYHIGIPFPLGEDARKPRGSQNTGSIWFEVRNDATIPNAYRHSTNSQPLHTDGSYIPDFPSSTMMLCVRNNVEGGETVFLDSNKLFSILQFDNPDLLKDLLKSDILHERSGSKKLDKVLKQVDKEVIVNWNYYCISNDITNSQRTLADKFQEFLLKNDKIKKNIINVKLESGDAVLWKDDYCLHGRNSFIADNSSDRFLWKCAIDVIRKN